MSLIEPAQGRIELSRPFLEDDAPLHLDIVRVELHSTHPIGFDRQSQLPAFPRKGEPVMGAVFGCFGVRLTTCQQDHAVDLTLGESLCSFEKHVLDKVREPGLAGRLVKRSGRVIQVANDHRSSTHGQDQNTHAVVKRTLGDGQIVERIRRGAGFQTSSHRCPLLTCGGSRRLPRRVGP